MNFLYPFLNFLQPGILFEDIAFLRPMLIASAIGATFGLMRTSDFPRRFAFLSATFFWLLAFILAQVLSVHRGGMFAMLDEFSYWIVFPMFVVVSVLLISNVTALRRFVWGLMVGSMIVVIYGIYAVPAWGGYIGSGRAGAYGMYENHNDYSFIIIQTLPFLFMYLRAETSFFKRVLLALSLLTCIVGMFMSLSRGGMIAMMLEMLLILLIGMQGRMRFLLLPLFAVFAAGAISYQYAKRAENQGDSYTAQDAESGRYELWKAGYAMFKRNPLLGVGSRSFQEFAPDYYELSHDMRGKVSHNTYIEVISTSGILGFVSFIFLIRSMLKNLQRTDGAFEFDPWIEITRKAALIALLALLVRSFLDAKAHDWSYYVLCAIAMTIHAIRSDPGNATVASDQDLVTAANLRAAREAPTTRGPHISQPERR